MATLARFSEPYPPTGGIASEGVRNLLGRPTLEPLELLVRESIQNSWDAKREDSDQVSVCLTLSNLDPAQLAILRSEVLPQPPSHLPLAEELSRSSVQILSISDRGTIGLEGPLRSDRIVEGDPSDFVDFIRDIGQPPDRHLGAGSFGYGKGAFYLLSRASTIIVHTRCITAEGPQTRLIACGLGEHFTDAGGVRLTGRHWWGSIAADGIVDPMLGDQADLLAESIGLRPFAAGETGTTIAILSPRLDVVSDEDEDSTIGTAAADRRALDFIAAAIAWNFWPKMVDLGEKDPQMRFEIEHDGEKVPVPDPDQEPRLRIFASAYRALKGFEEVDSGLGGELVEAWCERPRRRLGTVSLRRDSLPPSTPGPAARYLGERLHHVALMRTANLVVQYVAGPPLPSDRAGYAGVFECALDLDQAFRRSEPPTHDRWEPQFLEKPYRRFVNVALKRVREVAEGFAAPATSSVTSSEGLAVGEFSSQLASLIPALPGPGAAFGERGRGRSGPIDSPAGTSPVAGSESPPASAARGGPADDHAAGSDTARRVETSQGSRARIEVVESARPRLVDGERVIEMSFRVTQAPTTTRVSAAPSILTLDGGAIERDPPEGARIPRLLGWIREGATLDPSSELTVEPDDEREWTARFSHQPDAVVRIELSADPA